MHGRLRVKTTEQQEAEKAVEREKKLVKYQGLTDIILSKYKDGVYDEETALQISQILSVNPDFYTLWNYRRKILQHWRSEKDEDYLLSMLTSDLQFTEQCLRVNPKSYHTWHHRCWIMENISKPDWKAEVDLCDRYLKLDGRNFHCWDYRRLAVSGAGRSLTDELATSDRLIATNFSNYSSWHYRSRLLSQLHPAPQHHPAPISQHVFHKELALVQNAAFTDPSDQAPWFYHRWLMQPARHPAASQPTCVCVGRQKRALVAVVFDWPRRPADLQLTLMTGSAPSSEADSVEEAMQDVQWQSVKGQQHDQVWVAVVSRAPSLASAVLPECDHPVSMTVGGPNDLYRQLTADVSASTGQILSEELANIVQLAELEPDNKWVLLSSLVIRHALDRRTHYDQMLVTIDQLIQLDYLREGYYRDLRSLYVMEHTLETLPVECTELRLPGRALTSLRHSQLLVAMTTLDVSDNRLRHVDLRSLVCARHVAASRNMLERVWLPAATLCQISCLLLDGNRLSSVGCLVVDAPVSSLRQLDLSDNPLQAGVDSELLELFPGLESSVDRTRV